VCEERTQKKRAVPSPKQKTQNQPEWRAPRKKQPAQHNRKMKEQAYEKRKTNQPDATWKVFAMVRLLTDKFSGRRGFAHRSAGTAG
jgi:hypothetical protein